MVTTLIALGLIVIVGLLVLAIYNPRSVEAEASAQEQSDLPDTAAVPPLAPLPIPAPAPAPENVPVMANFNIAYAIVRDHEAGYQNNPNDRGNKNSLGQLVGTNWGINAQVYERHLGRPPSVADMRNMPQAVAKGIFKELYWDRIYGDTIPDQQLANIFLDGVINHGQGVRLMQEVLGVPQDNRYGPITHSSLLAADPRQLHDAFKKRRRQYYHQIVGWDPGQRVFLNGWLRRIDSFNYDGGGQAAVLASIALASIAYFFTA